MFSLIPFAQIDCMSKNISAQYLYIISQLFCLLYHNYQALAGYCGAALVALDLELYDRWMKINHYHINLAIFALYISYHTINNHLFQFIICQKILSKIVAENFEIIIIAKKRFSMCMQQVTSTLFATISNHSSVPHCEMILCLSVPK